jgi:hypothetical protein
MHANQIFHSLSADLLAEFLSELSGFPHLTTFLFELAYGNQSRLGWPTDAEETLFLATTIMNANPTLGRVAFEMRDSWTNSRWPCYARVEAGRNTRGFSTTVFEGFDILGPESYRDF